MMAAFQELSDIKSKMNKKITSSDKPEDKGQTCWVIASFFQIKNDFISRWVVNFTCESSAKRSTCRLLLGLLWPKEKEELRGCVGGCCSLATKFLWHFSPQHHGKNISTAVGAFPAVESRLFNLVLVRKCEVFYLKCTCMSRQCVRVLMLAGYGREGTWSDRKWLKRIGVKKVSHLNLTLVWMEAYTPLHWAYLETVHVDGVMDWSPVLVVFLPLSQCLLGENRTKTMDTHSQQ